MANASLDEIYDRLQSVPAYHPLSADTYADWATEAGDLVTVSRGDTSYRVPIGTSTLRWRGRQEMRIVTEGSREREPISKVSAQKYAGSGAGSGGGSGGIRNSQGLFYEMISEDGYLRTVIEANAEYFRTLAEDNYNGLYSRIEQTASYIRSEVANTASGLYSRIEQTASSIRSEVATQTGDLYTRIEQNATEISLKVSQGDVATRLAVEAGNVTIENGNLVVSGYVTASALDTQLATLTNSFSENIVTTKFACVNGSANTFTIYDGINYKSSDEADPVSLLDAINGIGIASESGGQFTIPTTRLSGSAGPNITFNIAASQTYSRGVAAARADGRGDMGLEADGEDGLVKVVQGSTKELAITATEPTFTYNSTGHYYRASASAKAGDTVMHTVTSIAHSGTQAYRDGKTDGHGEMGLEADGENGQVKVVQGSTKTLTISVTTPTFEYNERSHQYAATAKAMAGETQMHVATAVSGTAAYQAGWDAACDSISRIGNTVYGPKKGTSTTEAKYTANYTPSSYTAAKYAPETYEYLPSSYHPSSYTAEEHSYTAPSYTPSSYTKETHSYIASSHSYTPADLTFTKGNGGTVTYNQSAGGTVQSSWEMFGFTQATDRYSPSSHSYTPSSYTASSYSAGTHDYVPSSYTPSSFTREYMNYVASSYKAGSYTASSLTWTEG